MASESETVMAVCAEWRDCIESADPSVWNDERIAGLVKTTKEQQLEYLARIEAAAKRVVVSKTETATVGNAAAIYAALVKIHDLTNALDEKCGVDPVEIRDIARAALSAPARQCDVGTADEQDARFSRFCVEKRSGSCSGCPDAVGGFTVANGIRECALVWAQTPYAEEGAKS